MRYYTGQSQYTLIDSSGGERLEDWNGVFLIRPDPQVIWQTPKNDPRWHSPHAKYVRSSSGGGEWKIYRRPPTDWQVSFGELRFNLKLMGFKHTGLFPEQAVNWQLMSSIIQNRRKSPFKVLNLFGYTGAASLACAAVGAEVVHVDASKGIVAMAKENAALSGLSDRKCRWIVDDCFKFVEREIRRGSRYDGIILDPPSYGRGPGGEVWQLESAIYEFLSRVFLLLDFDSSFLLLNSYSTGLSGGAMACLVQAVQPDGLEGDISADEIGIAQQSGKLALPCGSTVVWLGKQRGQ